MTRSYCLIADNNVARGWRHVPACRGGRAVLHGLQESVPRYASGQRVRGCGKKAADRCFICHQGKNRKNHNPFGDHLVEMLDRKTDLRDKEKISAAIKKVVAMHVDPKDEKSETYVDRIKASKWPGGELAELKKEPPKEEQARTSC